MRYHNYRGTYLSASSPSQELKQGFDKWVRRLRSLEQVPEDPPASPAGIHQQGDRRIESGVEESDSQPRSADEGCWQGDGGENAEGLHS